MIYGRVAATRAAMPTPNERLRKARTAAGYKSISAACRAHGWHRSTYGAHENGQNDYTPEQAEVYAKAYKVKPDWLLFGDRGEPPPESPGIDDQLLKLDDEVAEKLIEKFNVMIETARIIGKVR